MDLISKILNDHFNIDLSKGKHNPLSKEAFKKVSKGQKWEVLRLIDGQRNTKEIAEIMGKEIHKISGRFTELKALNLIDLSHSKDGYSVYKEIQKETNF